MNEAVNDVRFFQIDDGPGSGFIEIAVTGPEPDILDGGESFHDPAAVVAERVGLANFSDSGQVADPVIKGDGALAERDGEVVRQCLPVAEIGVESFARAGFECRGKVECRTDAALVSACVIVTVLDSGHESSLPLLLSNVQGGLMFLIGKTGHENSHEHSSSLAVFAGCAQ